MAMKVYPEIKDKIKEVFIMGGSYTGTAYIEVSTFDFDFATFSSLPFSGRGNIVPTAEFNFYHDPEAVFIVLNYLKSAITILPIETDENLHLTMVLFR